MNNQRMWKDWIRLKMVSASQRRIPFDLSSEADVLGRDELDDNLLPADLNVERLPEQVLAYMYEADGSNVWGYILTSERRDIIYVAGVLVDGKLSWAELGDEVR
ncbi:hypothetical protein [Levilactobacillus mulengensis]|uniref:hypothetical protein n=1 Tax=Levilactobacillus mulengensis TaxID=2486025 RepID=UPI0013DDA664|nr:hypothetical protein [Levilactobacillus mulengensis]